MPVTTCQLCNGTTLKRIIDLGDHPLGDYFVPEAQRAVPEKRYPLRVVLCEGCGHTQLDVWVSPQERYQTHEYSYTASNSAASVKHFEELAQAVSQFAALKQGDLVVDIGSNDGTLLSKFKDAAQARVLGIDPSPNVSAIANEKGIETLPELFGDHACEVIKERGGARAITSTNTFNHISDMQSFITQVRASLTEDGVFVFEVPYMWDLVRQRAFDTIYLEHILYFSVKPFARFFKQYDLFIQKLERTPYMGGSIRVFVGMHTPHHDPVPEYAALEDRDGIFDPNTYTAFMADIGRFKENLLKDIATIKQKGGRIIGIGAATKGNTLLNYCGIDSTMLDFVTDSSPLKIGKYTPGSRIPIKPDEAITPDITHAVILPWNIADLLQKKLARPGLSFIIPHL